MYTAPEPRRSAGEVENPMIGHHRSVDEPYYMDGNEVQTRQRRASSSVQHTSVMRQNVTLEKAVPSQRYMFKFLPNFCSNDLVEGSWWFVWGSLISAIIAAITLADTVGPPIFATPEHTSLSAFGNASSWIFLLIMGVFYTIGAFSFVRAFDTPPRPPLFTWRHLGSDELLGAWCNFFGTVPSIFYCLVYIGAEPHVLIYWAGLVASIFFTGIMAFFVYACYEEDENAAPKKGGEEPVHYARSLTKYLLGRTHPIVKHVANDWLASCWMFFWASLVWAVGSFLFLFSSENERQDFVYCTSLVDAIFFTFGSAYFVAGSYPLTGKNNVFGNPVELPKKTKLMPVIQEEGDEGDEREDGGTINALHQQQSTPQQPQKQQRSPSPLPPRQAEQLLQHSHEGNREESNNKPSKNKKKNKSSNKKSSEQAQQQSSTPANREEHVTNASSYSSNNSRLLGDDFDDSSI